MGDTLLQDFTNSGLPQSWADQSYFFLHLPLRRLLAASALAHVANACYGREGTVAIGDLEVTVRHLVDRKAWDPAWQEVFTGLAGRVENPTPLLQRLEDEDPDDVFRLRLALAARCRPVGPGRSPDP